MSNTNTYSVGNIRQLVELSGGNDVNFKLKFKVQSNEGSPFQVLVISEEDLNNGKETEFKNVDDGYIEAEIVNNNNQNVVYYLILRAEEPCECQVTIDKQQLPLIQNKQPVKKPEDDEGMNWWLIGGLVILVAVGTYWAWTTFVKNDGSEPSYTSETSKSYQLRRENLRTQPDNSRRLSARDLSARDPSTRDLSVRDFPSNHASARPTRRFENYSYKPSMGRKGLTPNAQPSKPSQTASPTVPSKIQALNNLNL